MTCPTFFYFIFCVRRLYPVTTRRPGALLGTSRYAGFQSRTVTEYIYLRTVLKYNFEGSVLYSSIIFGEYSWLYSSTFERQILYSLLHYISIHNREYPLLLLKKKEKIKISETLNLLFPSQTRLDCAGATDWDSLSPSAFRQSQLHGQIMI